MNGIGIQRRVMQNELVGWVEALSADTHRIQFSARYPLMGFAESALSEAEGLNPSYMLTRPTYD